MNILCAINKRFMSTLKVLLVSVLVHHKQLPEIALWVLHRELDEDDIADLQKLSEQYPNFVCKAIQLDEADYDKFPITERFTAEACFRILAPWVLPITLERILWLDADMLCTGDLTEFYMQDFQGNYASACIDPNNSIQKKQNIGLKESVTYFNSGLMLFDLPAIRNHVSLSDFFSFFETYHDGWPDQDALNVVLAEHVRLWSRNPYNYFIFTGEINQGKNLKDKRLLHFIHSPKPIEKRNFKELREAHDLYYEYAALAGYDSENGESAKDKKETNP
jgi:lipopolysaccharide biosynthesis glycosyltransferase